MLFVFTTILVLLWLAWVVVAGIVRNDYLSDEATKKLGDTLQARDRAEAIEHRARIAKLQSERERVLKTLNQPRR